MSQQWTIGANTKRHKRPETMRNDQMGLTRMKHHRGATFSSSNSNSNNNNEALCSKIFVLLQVFLIATTASATTAPSRYGWTSSSSSSGRPCSFVIHSSCKNVVPSFDIRSLLAARGGASAAANDDSISNGGDDDDEQVFYDAVQEEEEEVGGGGKDEATEKKETPKGNNENADEEAMPAVEEEEDEDDSGMKWDAGEANVPGETAVISEEEEDSSANVDKMDYADAYDDDEEEGGGGGETSIITEGFNGETDVDGDSGSVSWTETVPANTATSTLDEDESSLAPDDDSQNGEHMISLASEISSEMKQVLIKELAYRRVDVEAMRPEIAAMVIAKKVRKPIEGLPRNWFIDENSAAAWRSKLQHTLLDRVAPIVALVLGAFIVSEKTNLLDIINFRQLPSMSNIFPSRQKVSSPLLPTIPETNADETHEEVVGQEMLVGSTSDEETTASSSVAGDIAHEHSLRPGEKPSPEPIDETALDRALTVITKKLSAIFQKKL